MRKPIYNTMPSRLGTQLEGITSYRITQRNCSKRKGFFFLTCSCRFLHMKHYSRNWSIDLNIFTIFRVLILKFFSINIFFSYTISERFSKKKMYVLFINTDRQKTIRQHFWDIEIIKTIQKNLIAYNKFKLFKN